MASAWVRVSISPGGDWKLPSEFRGMLFRFNTGVEEETVVAGQLKTIGDADICPGNIYEGGLFIEGDRGDALLEPGRRFVVWYVNDVGWGEVVTAA